MLSEAQARELLQAAGDTIEVEPAQPLPVVDRPKIWPMLVAAAAVVAIVVTALAVVDRGTTPPPPSTTPTPTPTLAANQIPPVMGLDALDAEEKLEALGLVVRTRSQPGCVDPRIAVGTSPPVGSRFSPGDEVQLTVEDDSMDFCDGTQTLAWGLLRFALGVSPTMRFAETVTLYPGGGEPVVLTAAGATEQENWEVCDGDLCDSALSILATAASAPSQNGAGPILDVRGQPRALSGPDPCMSGADIDAEGLTYLGITIDPPTDGVGICPEVAAYYSETGLLEAVAIPLFPEDEPEPQPTAQAASASERLVAWARGSGLPPPFADEVRYLVNDSVVRKMSGTNATHPESWEVCYSGLPLGCPSPLSTLDDDEGDVVQTSSPAVSCVSRMGRIPEDLADLELVRLDQPEAKDCRDAWAIEVWVNPAGQIAAINQLPGTAAPPAL